MQTWWSSAKALKLDGSCAFHEQLGSYVAAEIWAEGEHREMRWERCGRGRTFSGTAGRWAHCCVGKGLEAMGALGGWPVLPGSASTPSHPSVKLGWGWSRAREGARLGFGRRWSRPQDLYRPASSSTGVSPGLPPPRGLGPQDRLSATDLAGRFGNLRFGTPSLSFTKSSSGAWYSAVASRPAALRREQDPWGPCPSYSLSEVLHPERIRWTTNLQEFRDLHLWDWGLLLRVGLSSGSAYFFWEIRRDGCWLADGVIQIVHMGSDLAETFAQAPPPQHPPLPPHTLPHSRGFPVTSGHCVLLGDGSVSLARYLQWQSTGQRRTENEFLPAGEATLEWGGKRGLGEGWGGSCALESRDPKWSRRQRPRAAGSQKSLGRGWAVRPSSLVLPALPRPQPAGYRLGLLYSGYVTPERGSRRRGG